MIIAEHFVVQWSLPWCGRCLHTLQVKKWFQYKQAIDPKDMQAVNIPYGPVCEYCGRMLESFPTMSLAQVKEQLADESDFTFHLLWEASKASLANPGDTRFGIVVVGRRSLTGVRSEWPYDFVEISIFVEKIGVRPDDKEFKMKTIVLRDPEGTKHDGILLKFNSVPSEIPHSKVTLYCDDHVIRNEVLLDKGESLHPKHSKNVEEQL
jgi:hypothetical protein